MRIREPKTTALVFASGKMVCTGAKSEEHSKLASRKVRATIPTIYSVPNLANARPFWCWKECWFCFSFFAEFCSRITIFYPLLFPSTVCANHPEDWVLSQVQGSGAFNFDVRRPFVLFLALIRGFWWHAGFQDPEHGCLVWCEVSNSFGGPRLFTWCLFQCKFGMFWPVCRRLDFGSLVMSVVK